MQGSEGRASEGTAAVGRRPGIVTRLLRRP